MTEAKCGICDAQIPAMRIEYLEETGLPKDQWTCVAHSQVKRKVAFFKQGRVADPSEVDTSELVICDYIDNGSRPENETEEDNE